MTGRETLGLRKIRAKLEELNANSDGPCGIAIIWDDDRDTRSARLVCADAFEIEPVIQIPGDGRAFPVKSCVEALAASQVIEWF